MSGGALQIVGHFPHGGLQILEIFAHLAHQILQTGEGIVGGLAGLFRAAVGLIDKGNHFAQITDALLHLGQSILGCHAAVGQIGVFCRQIGGDFFDNIILGGTVDRAGKTIGYQCTQLFVHNVPLPPSAISVWIRQSMICLTRCHSCLFSR